MFIAILILISNTYDGCLQNLRIQTIDYNIFNVQ